MNTFSLKVIARDKVFFDGKCGIIIVPALDGEQAIMYWCGNGAGNETVSH